MPYIWRHLKPNTRKYMIELSNKPIEKINITFHIFQERKLYFYLKKKYRNI